ncbi:metal ABC transporter solute-binding protein, Zn/Mn family [Phaeobacter inhibens]|uniref:metal ABC transporter solute-binding protein, Zn/Mn family n=1 Tax=Phaeobacter inhibens TaxID=221822 RepID=UPI000274B5FA|nr:zinc ABC transporter substrate-binding protein [Phaeobacter inhibens]AFO89068.1 manganese-binding lipoprotein MntA [Phaeobacter inhibens 2.10]AUQ55895.1 manganese-binding lipoprotein MntA [Phaeobacter inhibens]AUQ79911.1 manganese-binding lipoprotein MntA [Phaeobacter inhibens]AUR17070.1 manganese-binding lipoprotein MntA [Phaeobacter inhibens]AXT43783.1 manganese transporter [Phaeobacter inhibens]
MRLRLNSPMMARRMMVAALMALAGLIALPMVGLGAGPARAEAPLKVVATTGMIADAARQVGGDAVEVRALMGPGVDPHAYRQTRSDIVAMTRADLVLWHGLYLEAQMEEFFHDLARKRTVVAVADGLDKDKLRGHDTYADKFDPHVWMTPALWKDMVAEVQAALTEARPDQADLFAANATAHLAELDQLITYGTKILAQVPAENRVLVTAHDAFGYFGRDFGFEVLGIQGISTQSEAGLNRIGELVDLLVERGVSAVFVESSVSDRSVRALIEGAAAQGHEVRIGGELFSDAMGADGSYEGTYVGMLDHNMTTIAAALGAEVPPKGMSGRLSGAGL